MADPEIEDEKEDNGGKKSSKGKSENLILIIIVVLALLFFVGAGVGVFMVINSMNKAQTPVEEATAGKETKKADKKGKEAEGAIELGTFYKFEKPIIVNLAETNAERYLKIDLVLELDSAKTTKEVDTRLPQIMDLLISISSNKTLDDISTTSGKNMYRQEIIDKINALMSTGKIKNAYFNEFVVQ